MGTILLPLIVSTSGWQSPTVDWAGHIDPPVAAVLCRASIGTPEWMGSAKIATDQNFPKYWPQWDALRWCRGAYHFLMNGAGGADQARWFVSCVKAAGGFHPCDRLILDAEMATGLSIVEIADFFWNCHVLVPEIPFENYLNYSRSELLNPLYASFAKLSDAQRDMMRRIPQWPGGYPNDPTGWDFERLAVTYQARTDLYGPAVIEQYAAANVVEGISTPDSLSVECNLAAPAYLSKWMQEVAAFYGAAPATPDAVTLPLPGVKVTCGRRFDTDVRVIEISAGAIQEGRVTAPGACKKIEDIQGDIVANGGDFDMIDCSAVGFLASHGHQYSPQADSEPTFGFKGGSMPSIDHKPFIWSDGVGTKRYLVVGGAVSPNTSDAWNARDARNIFGVKQNGDLVILSTKGAAPDQAGLDLFMCARTMLEFGAYVAADADGGESVQSRVAGEIFEGSPARRPVADFVTIVVKAGGPQMDKYLCTVIWPAGAAIRPEPSTSNAAVAAYPAGSTFYASELVADMDAPLDSSKQWARITSDPNHGATYAGHFVAVKYPASSGAVDRCSVQETGTIPPPTDSRIDHIEVVYVDGSRENFVAQAP